MVAFNTGVISVVFVKGDQKKFDSNAVGSDTVCLHVVTAAFVLEPSQDFSQSYLHTP